MKILKSRIFLVLATAIIVGSITAYATISPNSESVIYDNTESGLTSTNLQDAIDELYLKANASGISEIPTLLWTNPNPNSEFAAKTVNVDFSEYNTLLILLHNRATTSNGIYVIYSESEFIPITTTTSTSISTYASGSYTSSRMVTLTLPNKIQIGTSYLNSGERRDDLTIPYKIYGYKNPVFMGE